VAGIDVGEDFLDITTLSPARRDLRLARVSLRSIAAAPAETTPRSHTNAVTSLGAMLTDMVPELRSAIVLVDSPRWPSDLDWSRPGVVTATNSRRGREIDSALRALVLTLCKVDRDRTLAPLSMFPTPPMRYFGAHLNFPACKPHLRMFGQALFGDALNREYGPPVGGIFTRFMIAGFATYRGLGALAAEVYECYPDLQFRLWRGRQQLFSKNSTSGRTAALTSRIRILSALARKLDIGGFEQIQHMDEADAAILALSSVAARQHGATLLVGNASEGSFMVALDEPQAQHLQQEWSSLS
jgi:hypothetical protein